MTFIGKPTSDKYYISDNGVGFDVVYVDKIFASFQRLHATVNIPAPASVCPRYSALYVVMEVISGRRVKSIKAPLSVPSNYPKGRVPRVYPWVNVVVAI